MQPDNTPPTEPTACSVCGCLVPGEALYPDQAVPCPGCGQELFPLLILLVTHASERRGSPRWLLFPVTRFAPEATLDRSTALRQVLDRMAELHLIQTADHGAILTEILRREGIGTTGIGHGVALPHTRFAIGFRPVGVIARFEPAIDYPSVDNEPVHTVCLTVLPKDYPGNSLRTLEALVRHFRVGP